MSTRPHRMKKQDRLIYATTSKDELACDMAVAPFDRAVREMDERWGVDRLPELVSPETAARYGTALAMLNEAIATEDPAKAQRVVASCLRGMQAMDAEATANGAQPASVDVWEIEYNGHRIGIMKDGRNWPTIKKARPDLALYTMQEVAVALSALEIGVVSKIKELVPGAEISAAKTHKQLNAEFWARGGDEINL